MTPASMVTTADAGEFTSKERDAETGLDWFETRYFSSAQGRFTSPDQPFAGQHAEDPQSWNMYGYVRNNPLRYTDPDGRDCFQGMSSCGDYLVGGLKAIGNIPSDMATAVNRGINLLTGSSIPDAPGFQPSNVDQAQGMQAASAVMMFAPLTELGAAGATAASATTADVPLITRNAAQGAAAQNAIAAETALTRTDVVQNLTLKTQSGVKTVMDVVSRDASGNVGLTEVKSSATARLTPNQAAAHPEIAQTGATVVGRGKPGYPGGTQIPPTQVQVVRPPKCPGGPGCSE